MTIPNTNVGFSDINTELGKSSSATITLNDSDVRSLAGKTTSQSTISIDDLKGKSATPVTLTVSRSPTSASGSGSSSTVTTGSVTASASGGTSPYSYSWVKVSGDTITAVSSSSASTTFRATSMTAGTTRTATFRCNATDSGNGSGQSGNVSVSITRTASYIDQKTITVGLFSFKGNNTYGYGGGTGGSISPNSTFAPTGTAITTLSHSSAGGSLTFSVSGEFSNSGWTTMTIDGNAFSRTAATFSANSGGPTYWTWSSVTPNPFGTTTGANKVVTFT